jgi:hypothetical protein
MAVRSALRAGRPLPVGRFLVLIFVRGLVDPRIRLIENPMTSSEIEPATFRPQPTTLPRAPVCICD